MDCVPPGAWIHRNDLLEKVRGGIWHVCEVAVNLCAYANAYMETHLRIAVNLCYVSPYPSADCCAVWSPFGIIFSSSCVAPSQKELTRGSSHLAPASAPT